MRTPIVLYGSTGHAQTVRDHALRVFEERGYELIAYIDDYRGDTGVTVDGVPVIGFDRWARDFVSVPFLVTISEPAIRRKLVERIEAHGGRFFNMVGTWPSISDTVRSGEGCFTGGPCVIGPNVTLGRHVQIQPMVTIGHDTSIGDFCTICSCCIAGWVIIEEGVFVGLGSTIVHGTEERPIRIGRGAYLCAGSVITKSVRPGAKMIGNPAQDMRQLAAERLRARRSRAS